MIYAVHLKAAADHIIAVSTDRFMMGVARATYTGDPFRVTVDVGLVDAMIMSATSVLRGRRRLSPDPQVTITLDDRKIECCYSSGASHSAPLPDPPIDFPDYQSIMSKAAEDTNNNAVRFNPALLAKFSKIKSTNMIMRTRPDQPCQVQVGDDFAG